jgi:HTH-type transcriptional regulator, sugar sensing transcriptional regulator
VQTADLELLEELGFTMYERQTLRTLMLHGVADADTLCRDGEIPSSKIYLALEKLAKLGLVEMQPTRPKLFSALSTDAIFSRLVEISQARADGFAAEAQALKERFAALPARQTGRTAFVDLALGPESQVKRHLVHLAAARNRIWSYMEHGDIAAIEGSKGSGAPLLRRIARNAVARNLDHRVVFGFGYRAAPKLVAFLKKHRTNLEHVTGVRYSGEFGHPFHVIDEETVILSVDHPFVPQGRVASLMVRDAALAKRLAEGFETLWAKAMRSLREIAFQPAR